MSRRSTATRSAPDGRTASFDTVQSLLVHLLDYVFLIVLQITRFLLFTLRILGDGVVANVLLRRTKGEGAGWIVITVGGGMAVFVGVFAVAKFSGAHLNPAVTLGLAAAGRRM